MKTTKTLPLVFLTALTLGSGAMLATAQESTLSTPEAVEAREDGRRGGHGHRFGGRGNAGMMMQMFQAVDQDGDGSVTQAEIDAFRTARVEGADTDGDGGLGIEEFATIYAELTRDRMVDAFQKLDADGDGVINAGEMDSRFGSVVERLDRNGDGALSIEDRRGRRG